MSGKLIVISGPSGVGKSTVVSGVMAQCDTLQFSVSATTRPMRPGEVDGKNYYFVDHATFQAMIREEKLLEYAQYVGNYYGTPEAPLNEALAQGKDVLLDIEVQGALRVKARRPDAVLIFMLAPSFADIEKRLYGRGDTAPALVEERLNRARWSTPRRRTTTISWSMTMWTRPSRRSSPFSRRRSVKQPSGSPI